MGSNVAPQSIAVPMIHVVAPATLPEGYEFEAAVGNGTIRVRVPPGGIEEGQRFEVRFPAEVESAVTGTVRVPVGHWRDSLLNVFGYGVCHPHLWTGCFCHLRKFCCRWFYRACA